MHFVKYVTWFLEFTYWLILKYAKPPGPSGDRGEMAMAIARLPCVLYAVHRMVFSSLVQFHGPCAGDPGGKTPT